MSASTRLSNAAPWACELGPCISQVDVPQARHWARGVSIVRLAWDKFLEMGMQQPDICNDLSPKPPRAWQTHARRLMTLTATMTAARTTMMATKNVELEQVTDKSVTAGRPWSITILKLVTAVARAGVSRSMSVDQARAQVLGAFFGFAPFLSHGTNLALDHTFKGFFKDSRLTSFSGQIGDALGLLYAESIGKPWFVHFGDVRPPGKALPRSEPDYVVSDNREAGLLECKASTSSAKPQYTARSRARAGFKKQVDPWSARVFTMPPVPSHPPATPRVAYGMCFAAAMTTSKTVTAVRQEHFAKSSLAARTVRLLSYGNWARIMELHSLADALLNGIHPTNSINVVSARIAGKEFVFSTWPDDFVHPLALNCYAPCLLGESVVFGLERKIAERIVVEARQDGANRYAGQVAPFEIDGDIPDIRNTEPFPLLSKDELSAIVQGSGGRAAAFHDGGIAVESRFLSECNQSETVL